MGRILLNLVTGVLLVLCAAVTVLWVRSCGAPDNFGRLRVVAVPATNGAEALIREDRSGVFSSEGVLAAGTGHAEMTPHPDLDPHQAGAGDSVELGWDRKTSGWIYWEYDDAFPFGFAAYPLRGHGVYSATPGYRAGGRFVSVPHWFVVLLLGLFPAWRMLAARRQKPLPLGRVLWVYAGLLAFGVIVAWSEIFCVFLVPLATGVVVAVVVARRRLPGYWVRRRIAEGCCPVCNYDLRATPERCPECGAVPGSFAAYGARGVGK
jgi:hypothetical protein